MKTMLIIGKSNVNSNDYDVLIYARRDLKRVEIPPFIKLIGSCAFAYSKIESIVIPSRVEEIHVSAFCTCTMLKVVDFQENSQLRLIGEYAFSDIGIQKICIPQNVVKIDKYAFSFINDFRFFDLSHNSMLQEIGFNCFSCNRFSCFRVPSHLTKVENLFFALHHLQIIEFDENISWEFVCKATHSFTEYIIILVPVQIVYAAKKNQQ